MKNRRSQFRFYQSIELLPDELLLVGDVFAVALQQVPEHLEFLSREPKSGNKAMRHGSHFRRKPGSNLGLQIVKRTSEPSWPQGKNL